jgi:AcrR family transcriptional regulator
MSSVAASAAATASAASTAAPAPADTRARILDVALELFTEHGFEGTTLQQIADRLGFTKAALYYHFRSKDDLLQALIAPVVAEVDALLSAHEDEPDTPAERRRFIVEYLDCLLGQRRLIAYMASDIAIIAHPLIAAGARDRQKRVMARVVDDELDFSEQVRVVAAFRGISGAIANYPNADTAELRAALIDVAKDLLRPGRRHPRHPRPATS